MNAASNISRGRPFSSLSKSLHLNVGTTYGALYTNPFEGFKEERLRDRPRLFSMTRIHGCFRAMFPVR